MATNAKPPRNRKGVPPKASEPLKNNLDKPAANELVGLHFRVPPEFHKQFKVYAAERSMSLVDVLKESFDLYREQNPV
jgi:hypothetical protein